MGRRLSVVRFDPDNRQQIYRDALTHYGVKIHEWVYQYGDDTPPSVIDNDYDMYILADLEYRGHRGWWYSVTDSCPDGGEIAWFEGWYKYNDRDYGPDEYNRLVNEYTDQCKNVGIPTPDLREFFDHIITYDLGGYYCNMCSSTITTPTRHQCVECTANRRSSFDDTFDVCWGCRPNHDSNHTLTTIKIRGYDLHTIDEIKHDNNTLLSHLSGVLNKRLDELV